MESIVGAPAQEHEDEAEHAEGEEEATGVDVHRDDGDARDRARDWNKKNAVVNIVILVDLVIMAIMVNLVIMVILVKLIILVTLVCEYDGNAGDCARD